MCTTPRATNRAFYGGDSGSWFLSRSEATDLATMQTETAYKRGMREHRDDEGIANIPTSRESFRTTTLEKGALIRDGFAGIQRSRNQGSTAAAGHLSASHQSLPVPLALGGRHFPTRPSSLGRREGFRPVRRTSGYVCSEVAFSANPPAPIQIRLRDLEVHGPSPRTNGPVQNRRG